MKIEQGGVTITSGVKFQSPIYETTVTFTTSGNLTIPSNYGFVSGEALLVAGGGGGNNGSTALAGGGGGAGGLLDINSINLLVPGQTYTIIVGGGGVAGLPGSNTSAIGYTAVRGGQGGAFSSGFPGGSGGGAGGNDLGGAGIYPGSSYISADRQGYDGGPTYYGGYGDSAGGGGGGRDSVGLQGNSASGGAGGSGYTSTISGSSVVYSQGGQGGRYNSSTAYQGSTNSTYGGGGPGYANSLVPTVGGNAGIVIIKYRYYLR